MVVLKGILLLQVSLTFISLMNPYKKFFKVSKAGQEWEKYLTLVKLKFLFPHLLTCSIQMQKNSVTVLVLVYK